MLPVNNRSSAAGYNFAEASASSSVAAATSETRSHEEYHAIWQAWEREAPCGEEEARHIAGEKLRDCLRQHSDALVLFRLPLTSLPVLPESVTSLRLEHSKVTALPLLPQGLKGLTISNNQLRALPELPPGLKSMDVSHNKLVTLPPLSPCMESLIAKDNRLTEVSELPGTLRVLDLSDNRLTTLPALSDSLTDLVVCNNNLTEPPRVLPQFLESLDLSSNQIVEFPSSLPSSLQQINLTDNQLSRLPESVISLNHRCQVFLVINSFSERTIRSLQNITSDPSYRGPCILFSIADGAGDERPVRPLGDVVTIWLPAESDVAEKWRTIANEENASAFSAFLGRLANTVNAKKDPEFKQKIAAWLAMLADSPGLRDMTFMVAVGATETCEDRVSYSWNEMQKLALAHRVENGEFDEKFSDLIATGRVMFRLEQLEEIAHEKVKTLHFTDEIEVWMAFQTMLHDTLALSTVCKEMRYCGVSGVTKADLKTAEIKVKQAENSIFSGWFSQWMPWQKVLKRTESARWQQTAETKDKAFAAVYPQRVASALAAAGLTGDADAERIIGQKVMQEMNKEIFTTLTREVLTVRDLASLINWQWSA